MAKTPPAFQLYATDILADGPFMEMTYEERGIYTTLLFSAWKEKGIPQEPERLQRLLKVDAETFSRAWPAIAPCWKPRRNRLVNPRQEEVRRKQAEYRRKKSDAAHAMHERRRLREAEVAAAEARANACSPSPTPSPSPKPKSTRARRRAALVPWPDDFTPTPARLALAAAAGYEADALWEDFHGKALARGYMYANWDQAWRNWIRDQPKYQPKGAANGKTGPAAEREDLGRRACERFGMSWQASYARVDREVWSDLMARYRTVAAPPLAEIKAALERNLGSLR